MLAALLALASSVLLGSSDFIGGFETRRHSVWSVALVSQIAGASAASILLLAHAEPLTNLPYFLAAVLGGVSSAFGLALYYKALSSGAMNVVAPIVAAAVVVPVLVGIAIGERPSGVQYVGMVLAVAGIVFISRAESRGGGSIGLRSILYAVIAALCLGATMVGLSIGGRADVYWSVFGMRFGGMVAVIAYLGVRRQATPVPRRALPAMAAVGVTGFMGDALFTAASTIGYLSIVSVLASLTPVATGLFAFVFLHERPSRVQLFAAGVVMVGVVALSAG